MPYGRRAPVVAEQNGRPIAQTIDHGGNVGSELAERIGRGFLRLRACALAAQAGRGYTLAEPVELLDVDRIRTQIRSATASALSSLDVAWSLDSTNSELLRRKAPERGVEALLAEQQTGGRGRRGRQWASPIASNLYLSLSRQFSGGLARLGGLSLVVGVAVAEALRQAGYGDVGVKWPNDLLAHGRKLGGILVEGGGEHGGPVRAVIGIGVNVRMPSTVAATIDQAWTDLAGLADGLPSRNALAARLLDALLPALDQFDADGLPPFLARYAALDVLAGRAVTVHGPQGDEHGVADGIGDEGGLRTSQYLGVPRQHAGEVSVRTT